MAYVSIMFFVFSLPLAFGRKIFDNPSVANPATPRAVLYVFPISPDPRLLVLEPFSIIWNEISVPLHFGHLIVFANFSYLFSNMKFFDDTNLQTK